MDIKFPLINPASLQEGTEQFLFSYKNKLFFNENHQFPTVTPFQKDPFLTDTLKTHGTWLPKNPENFKTASALALSEHLIRKSYKLNALTFGQISTKEIN